MENNNEIGQALSAVSALKGIKSKQSEAAASSSFASSLAREAISTESDIALQIRKLVVDKLGVSLSAVTSNASFTNDLGADSLDKVELIMELEKDFGVSIPDDEAEKLRTVGQAIKYIETIKGQ
jgi:acyl carrier protein